MPNERIGFVGLGIMGEPMARNVMKAGFPLTVWNRTAAKADALVAEGARMAASPAEVAAASDIVVSCVSDSPDVEAVALGEGGILEGIASGANYIDCSTISPTVAREVAARFATKGAGMLDAPISGGDIGAKAGTLAIMVGGETADFERCKSVLEAMGKTIVHVGPPGSGQVVKLCNQIAGGLNLLAMAEAITLCRSAGVDPERMLQVVSSGAAGSWMLTNLGPRAVAKDYAPGFMVDLMQKDLRLVMEASADLNTPLAGSALVQQIFRVLQARGRGRDGTQAIVDAVSLLGPGDAG